MNRLYCASETPMLSDQGVVELLACGPSIVVGTVDADNHPSACRAVAIEARADRQGLTLYLPLATSAEAIANIASNGRVAITISRPADHRTIQIKGRSERVRVATADEASVVTGSIEAFADTLDDIGLPRGLTRRLASWPAFAVEVQVEALFEQSPGPRAGAMVKSR